jgi:preprotein translocase subunit SecE
MARKRRRVKAKKDEQKSTTGGYAFAEKEVEQTSGKPAVKPKAEDKKPEAKAAPPKATAKRAPSSGQKMGSFLKDVRAEVKKVNWPDQERTTQSTGVVIFTLLVLAGFMTLFTMLFTKIAGYLFS